MSDAPRIAVVGAGAFGSLLAARLHAAGEPVILVARRAEHVAALRDRGLTLHHGEQHLALPVPCVRIGEPMPDVEIAIVCVKAYDTTAAATALGAMLSPDAAVMTLQNGAGNLESLVGVFGRARVIAGVSTEGAQRLSDTEVRHTGRGETRIGEAAGGLSTRVENLAATLRRAGFAVEVAGAVEPLIWRKLIVSAGINALTAVLDVPNGYLWENAHARAVMDAAVSEAVATASVAGMDFDPADMIELTRSVARRTAANRSSMATDLYAGRPTEIEAIQGYIVDHAQRHGIDAPTNRLLRDLVRALQDRKDRTSTGP